MKYRPNEKPEHKRQPIPEDCRVTLQCVTADTIAECYPVSRETYRHLWNEIVPLQPELDPEPIDRDDRGALVKHWHKLPAQVQADVIAAIRKEAQQ